MSGDLRFRIAEACRKANTGLFGDGECDDWFELADAVLADLDIRECCVVCGLIAAECVGQDHGEYEHDYEALLYLAPDEWAPCAACGGSGGSYEDVFVENGCLVCEGQGATRRNAEATT